MDERFLESVVHKRAPLLARLNPVATRLWRVPVSGHVVLGRRLRPFSLWHQQMLQGVDNPFLSTWKEQPTSIELFASLYIATEICSVRPFSFPVATGLWPVIRRKIVVLRFYLRFGIAVPSRRLHKRLSCLLIEAKKFMAYVADYSSAPIAFPTKHSRPVQTPVSIYQIELYRRFHQLPTLNSQLIWAMSPGEIAWANTAALEAHGTQIEIMTEARMEAREAAIKAGKEQNAKRKAQGASNGNGYRK